MRNAPTSADYEALLLSRLKAEARIVAWDHWVACAYAPADLRLVLLVLALMGQLIRRIPVEVSEPHLAAIRFAWWRDCLEAGADHGESAGSSPLAVALIYCSQKEPRLREAVSHLLHVESEKLTETFDNYQSIKTAIKASDGYECLARLQFLLPSPLTKQQLSFADDLGLVQACARLSHSKIMSQSKEMSEDFSNLCEEGYQASSRLLRQKNALVRALIIPLLCQRAVITAARHNLRSPSRLGLLMRICFQS